MGGGAGFGNGFASGNSFSSVAGANYQQQARVVNTGPVLVGQPIQVGGGNFHGAASSFHGNGFQQQQHHQQQQGHGIVGGNFNNAAFATGHFNGGNNGFVGQNFHAGGQFLNGGAGIQTVNAPQFLPSPNPGPIFNQGPAFVPTGPSAGPTVVQKHIYVHVPPPEAEEHRQQQTQFLPAAPAQKHYKIIFIKTPNQQPSNAALIQQAAAAQTQEKTLIYVLVKKPEDNLNNLILQQNAAPAFQPTKPEVYFIKYKSRGQAQGQHQQEEIIGGGQAIQNGGAIISEGGNANLGGAIIGATASGNGQIAAGNFLGESHDHGFGTGSSQNSQTVIQGNANHNGASHSEYGVPH